MVREQRPNDRALHTDALPVDQAHLPEPTGGSRVEVFLHHRRDVARPKGMKVEVVLDRDRDRLVVSVGQGSELEAGLNVLLPVLEIQEILS